jgi:plasmid maintenance system killer protein
MQVDYFSNDWLQQMFATDNEARTFSDIVVEEVRKKNLLQSAATENSTVSVNYGGLTSNLLKTL